MIISYLFELKKNKKTHNICRELNFSPPSASDLTPIFNVALDNFHRPSLVTSLKLCDNTSPAEKLVEEFHLTGLDQRVPNSTWYRYASYLRLVEMKQKI